MQVWSKEDTATLKTMWTEKHPARAIADALGKSRNAIIGKARRLKLEARRSVRPRGSYKAVQKLTAATNLRPFLSRPALTQPSPTEGVSILDARHDQCKAVIGTSDGPHGLAVMCGKPTVWGTSWCEYHLAKHTTVGRVR